MASANSIINLSTAQVLVMENSNQGMDILSQILMGLGVRAPHRCETPDEAMSVLERLTMDLIITEAKLQGEMSGYDFVKWLRRNALRNNASVGVVMISGHTPMSDVARSRDCGANVVITKPLTPKVLLDRILWLAADKRPFVECDVYFGPDRRWHNTGVPVGKKGKRNNDLSAEVGAATEPNLDQGDIDQMFRPTKVSL